MRISFDRIADRYDETRAYPAGVTERIVEALDEVLSESGRILDVGMGTGRLAAPISARGFDVVGVDISLRMLEKARAKRLEDIVLADARALPFPDRSFDYTLSVHLTHLIEDWMTALSEIGRVTSERYVSVATEREGCQIEEMQSAYEEVCAEWGHVVRHPGVRERELVERMRPLKVVCVADSVDLVGTETALTRFRERVYSDLWEVPDGAHARAMAALEERYRGCECLERRQRISVIVWDAGSVRRFVRSD